MGQINTTSLPEYVSETRQAATKLNTSNEQTGLAVAPQDALQLTKLSGVLNNFKKSASAMRSQLTQVMGAVRSGTYQVDPLQVSRRIVGESLASR